MAFPLFATISYFIALGTVLAAVRLQRRPVLAACLAVVGSATLLGFHVWYFDYYADDSFITLRYSKHFAEGLGPNWNGAGHVEGYTSFLWMAGLAGFGKLGANLVPVSRVLGFAAVVTSFVLLCCVWRLWSQDAEGTGLDHPLVPAAALVGLALTDSISFWAYSGMESALFMALLVGSVYLYLREQRGAVLPWSAVAFAATAMTRPEGAIVAVVTAAFVLVPALRSGDRKGTLRRALLWCGVFAVLYGSYFAWRYSYYGCLLPNTFYAKVGLNRDTLDRGLNYVANSGLGYQLLAMIVGLALLSAAPRLRRDGAYIAAITGALLAALVIEGGGDSHGRFLIPVLPLLFLSGLGGYAVTLHRAALGRWHTGIVTAGALSLAALSLLPASRDALLPLGRQSIDDRRVLGAWLNDNTPPGYSIADFQIGAVAYYSSDRDSLDLLGLNDVKIAHTHIEHIGSGVPGHEKYNLDYVFDDAKPEIISIGQVSARPMTLDEVRRAVLASAWIPASQAFFTDPRLWDRYVLRAVELDGRWFHFLQRKDTLAELQVRGVR